MEKQDVYKAELAKLKELFAEVEPSKIKLVEGLIQDAAFLYAENFELRELLNDTGSVKVHPNNKGLQKPVPAAKEYRQNLNSYAVIIKTLNGVLKKEILEEDDDLDEFE